MSRLSPLLRRRVQQLLGWAPTCPTAPRMGADVFQMDQPEVVKQEYVVEIGFTRED